MDKPRPTLSIPTRVKPKREEKLIKTLPVDVLAMGALYFPFDILNKTCKSEEMKGICSDPKFWFKKLQQERLALDDPIVLEWIKIWIGSPIQTDLMDAITNGESFNLVFIDGLIRQNYEHEAGGLVHGNTFVCNPNIFTEIDTKITQAQVELEKHIVQLIDLETIDLILNYVLSIMNWRMEREKTNKLKKASLINDYIQFTVPRSINASDVQGIATYQEYLDLLEKKDIDVYDLYEFIETATIINISTENAGEDNPVEQFRTYLVDHPDKRKSYQEMARKKAKMVGLHLKSGDTLHVGGIMSFVVIRDVNTIHLHPINHSVLPAEARSLVIKHEIQTRPELRF